MSANLYRRQMLAANDLSGLSLSDKRGLVKQAINSQIHGICFSPFTEEQGPKSILTADQIRKRLAIIAPHVKAIRTFSCTRGHELIPAIAKEFGLQVLAGVWLDEDEENNQLELQAGIQLANDGLVDMLGVGNEVLLREELTSEQLIGYLEQAKTNTAGVPVGYVDAYYLFRDNPEVADACDILFANCYPFWEGYPAEHALVYAKEMYRQATMVAKGKPVVVSETGWPNKGSAEAGAVPSEENAVTYFLGCQQWAEQEGIEMFYFAAFDEAWKVAAEGDVGAYWGLWDADGSPKYWP